MTNPITEADVLHVLREHHNKPGNGGGEYAFLTHVRNAAGVNATRTIDALTLSLWPSRGPDLHADEVKVYRSDWQRELADPAKAEEWCQIVDRFTIAAPSGVIKKDEVPPTWGWVEITGDGTDLKPWKHRTRITAPRLRNSVSATVTRSLLVCMMRSAPGAVPGGKVPAVTQPELDASHKACVDAGTEQAKW